MKENKLLDKAQQFAVDIITSASALKAIGQKSIGDQIQRSGTSISANIAEGKKSMAITITYRKDDGTLTDKEISDAEDNIKFELSRNFKAEIRS